MAIAIGGQITATTTGTTTSTSSFTITGSDTILIVTVQDQSNTSVTNVTGVTCNGVSLTKIDAQLAVTAYGASTGLWALLNPSSGVITATRTTSGDRLTICAAYYTGVDQTTPVSSLPKAKAGQVQSTTFTGTITSPTNGWAVMGSYVSAGGGPATAGSGTTLRIEDTEIGYLWDSNGAVSGSTTLNVTNNGNYYYGYVITAIAPVVASTSHIKSWNGITN